MTDSVLNPSSKAYPVHSTISGEVFLRYFQNKIANYRHLRLTLISLHVLLAYLHGINLRLFRFPEKSLPSQAYILFTGPWIILQLFDILEPSLLSIVNRSLSLGTFPGDLKHALIVPSLKQTNLDSALLKSISQFLIYLYFESCWKSSFMSTSFLS